jgi:hypothetical protein
VELRDVYSRVLIDLNKANLSGELLIDDVFRHTLFCLKNTQGVNIQHVFVVKFGMYHIVLFYRRDELECHESKPMCAAWW